jgi:Mg/Co/Ni transporter MgtE
MKNLNGERIAWLAVLVMAAAGTAIMVDELTTDKALFQQHLAFAVGFAVLIVGSLWGVERWYRNKFPPDSE